MKWNSPSFGRSEAAVKAGALLLFAAFAAGAEPSSKIEMKADRELECQRYNKAQELYRQAGEQRLKETSLYEVKKSDDLDLGAGADLSDDDDMGMGGDAAAAQMLDALANNYILAAYDFEKGAKPRRCDECLVKAEAVKGVSRKIAGEIAKLKKFIEKSRDASEHEPPPPKTDRDPFAKMKEKIAKAEGLVASKASAKSIAAAWSDAAHEAYLHHRDDVMRRGLAEVRKLKCSPTCYAERWVASLAAYDNLAVFPKGEAETVSPKTLADLGVVEKQTLVAGEIDWDPEDATKCVEEALASGATTVVFTDRGSPWYVKTVRPRSNQRLVFKKGVRMYMDRVSCQNNDKSPMIHLKGVENVIIEGEGGPGDVVIAKFPDKASRQKWQNEEGGTGIYVSGSRNVVIRNLTSSWNSCDGIGISGIPEKGPSANVWIENVVLSDNYRQGMSIIDGAGVFCRNVSFLNTTGGDPMCGVDLEQNYDSEATSDCYFYDCTFGGNVGGAINWSAGGYFPVTAHLKRCRFLPAPTHHQISVNARNWSCMLDNMHAPAKLVFEDCEMTVNTFTDPFLIGNSSAYDLDIRNFRIKDVGPRKPGAAENARPAILFDLKQDFRQWGRDSVYDFEKNGARIHVAGLVYESSGDPKPVAFNDENGGYSVTNITGEAVINGRKWDMAQFFYNAPEHGWGIVPKFDPEEYGAPKTETAKTPDELPMNFKFNWRGPWWDPAPEYRALYFEKGEWKMRLVKDNVRELGLEGRPVAFYCRSNNSRFILNTQKKGAPYTVYFEVPAGGRPCNVKFKGGAVLKNPGGEAVATFERWKNKYGVCRPASDKAEIWSLTVTSDSGTLWMYPPLAGIIAENPDWLPRKK